MEDGPCQLSIPPFFPRPLFLALSQQRLFSNISKGEVQSASSDSATTESGETSKSLIYVAVIFLSALCVMLFVYYSFPELEEINVPPDYIKGIEVSPHTLCCALKKLTFRCLQVKFSACRYKMQTVMKLKKQHIKLPRDLDDAKALGKVLSRYNDKYYYQVCEQTKSCFREGSLQTFAIPGSISLSILSGFLFRFPLALFLVCLCSAAGASNCYLLSHLVGVKLVKKYIPERVEKWSGAIARHREHLLNYIIFLRITPFLPNWFINITSPVLQVPLWPFFLGTFLGVAPPSFVAIQAGTTLYQLTHTGDAVSWTSVIVLAILAVLSILPAVFKQYLRKKFE
ncbi:putative transmembrane protein [Apostichopus japonicus]|uniref:Putative transmembrane protein n=1 Tax=Stichopus japonicus TaxID=307972 RepID=A0A2G8KFQ2_STIJA|nr:putative transmembrane protein [Apostichopus japonicus]